MRLLIIRHGDPDYEHDTLTEKGRREAQLLAERLSQEKIDYFYSSPLGRARRTCEYVAKAHGREQDIVECAWLREFDCLVTLPSGREQDVPWDMLSSDWVDNPKMYRKDEWYKQDFYEKVDMENRVRRVVDGLDTLLANHGYKRDGNIYRTEQGHRETVALFCHFGLEMLLLSHLMNVSPVPLWHHFCAPPSSVTTLYTEERREGIAVFRCASFGDTGHLYVGGEEPSFSARFCETYHSDERHD